MGCINILHGEKILKDGTSAAVLLAAVGSFRMKTMSLDMSMRCVHLACKHNAECARLILKEGHGSSTSPVDAKDQLTLKLLHVVARTHSARYIVPENALKGTHSANTDFWYLHESPLAILMAPMSKRVEVISSLDKSTGHLLPYLPDLQADAEEVCVTALAMLVVVEENISSEVADMSMKRLIVVDSGDCVAVQDGSMSYVKLLLCFKTDMKVQDLRKHGPIHMAAFQDICFNLNSANMVPWDISSLQENQVMNNESGARLLNDEFDYFNKSYTGVKTSACHWHFLSRKCSSEMAKSQCGLKQDSKFEPQKHDYYMSNILVGCLAHAVDSEYLTAYFNAELVYAEKAIVNELKRGNELKHQGFGFLEFEIEKGALDAVARSSLLWPPKWIPLAKSVSSDIIELAESTTDHQYPIDPPTASITEGSPHHIESQQVDACSKINVQNQQGNNCSRNHTERVTIFVRQISGKLVVLTVNLDEPSEHMMRLYEEKTKMKLSYQYFIYERKTIGPEHTLLFYGVGRNSTVHACGRLLGGMPTTLASYVHDNRDKFLKEVTLSNGKISLKITKKGCRFLSTWLNCFTRAFSVGKSWNGEFTLHDFKHVDGHIRNIKKPRICPAGSMETDLRELVFHVEKILHSDKEYLISKYPPYLKNLTRFLSHMTIKEVLSDQDKLLVETHVCCTTSCDRETLVISLYRRYEGLDEDEMSDWDDAIGRATWPVPWSTTLSELEALGDGRKYPKSKFGAFKLIKDIAMHATDNRNESEEEPQNADGIELMIQELEEEPENADGIELMIPACAENFLPSIIQNLIEKNVDISAELLAAKIKCFCKKCESAHSSDSSDS